MERNTWPRWAFIAAASLGMLGLAAFYVAALRYIRESSLPDHGYTADERDALYLAVHAGFLAFALLLGFTLGKLANGRGFGLAVVFAVVTLLIMGGALIGSRELACAGGHNDIVRHWEC